MTHKLWNLFYYFLHPLLTSSLSGTNIDITWLITVRGGNWPWVLGTFILIERSQVRQWGKIGLNQSSIYEHPFPPISPRFFYFPPFNSVAKIKIVLSRKSIGEHSPPPYGHKYYILHYNTIYHFVLRHLKSTSIFQSETKFQTHIKQNTQLQFKRNNQ